MTKKSKQKNTERKKSKQKTKEKTVFHKSSDAGKGDVPRGRNITQAEWDERWEKVFDKKRKKKIYKFISETTGEECEVEV
jgi:hypothetical protein